MAFSLPTKFVQILMIMIILMSVHSLQQNCHYSCANCTNPSYISCFSCADPSQILKVLQNPQKIDSLYMHSIYESGICAAKVPQGTNGLGIFLIIISIISLLITQSHQLFYICSTFQTLSLFGLLQVAWLEPASYILQSFEYFMPINIMLKGSKTKDYLLFIYGFYRLDEYMISAEEIGLIILFIIDSILFLFIVVVFILTLFRRKTQAQMKEQKDNEFYQNENNLVPQMSNISDIEELDNNKNFQSKQKRNVKNVLKNGKQNQVFDLKSDIRVKEEIQNGTCSQKLIKIICEKASQCLVLRKILHISIYVFYFFIQQTALSIMVGAVFDISSLDVGIWVVYFIQIVTVLVISIYETEVDKKLNPEKKDIQNYGLSLFLSRQCLFIVLLKKIVLPLGVVFPPDVQYVFFVLYLLLFLIQGSLDARSGRVACLSRITLWKIFQMCITTLIITFFFNEKKGSSASNSKLITIILTITLVIFIMSFFIELVISLISMLLGFSQVHNVFKSTPIKNQNNLHLNNTEMVFIQVQKDNTNIFDNVQITRENTKTPRNNKNTHLKNQQQYQKQTVEVEQFSQKQQDDISRPPIINHQLLINKSKEQTIKPSSGKNPQQQIQKQESQKQSTEEYEKQRFGKLQKSEDGKEKEKEGNKVKRRRIEDPQLRRRYGIK